MCLFKVANGAASSMATSRLTKTIKVRLVEVWQQRACLPRNWYKQEKHWQETGTVLRLHVIIFLLKLFYWGSFKKKKLYWQLQITWTVLVDRPFLHTRCEDSLLIAHCLTITSGQGLCLHHLHQRIRLPCVNLWVYVSLCLLWCVLVTDGPLA